MEDFNTWFLNWWPTLATSLASVVTSVAAFIVYRVKIRHQKAKEALLVAQLNDAIKRATYTVCPHCSSQVKLEELKWYLPTGERDQNLNGIADDKEN